VQLANRPRMLAFVTIRAMPTRIRYAVVIAGSSSRLYLDIVATHLHCMMGEAYSTESRLDTHTST